MFLEKAKEVLEVKAVKYESFSAGEGVGG